MNRTTLLVLALIVVVGGYLLFVQTDEVTEPSSDVTENVEETPEDMAEPEVEDAGGTTEAAGDTRPEPDVTEDVGEAETEAAEETTDTGADAPGDTPGEAPVADGGAAEETSDGAAFPNYLTVEGFDAERAREALDASDVGTVEKASLQAAISAAEDDPALRGELLERLREALGL